MHLAQSRGQIRQMLKNVDRKDPIEMPVLIGELLLAVAGPNVGSGKALAHFGGHLRAAFDGIVVLSGRAFDCQMFSDTGPDIERAQTAAVRVAGYRIAVV